MWSIRWPIGWPNCAFTPGIAHVPADGFHQLRSVRFGLPSRTGASISSVKSISLPSVFIRVHRPRRGRAAPDGRDLRMPHQCSFDEIGQTVAFFQRGAGHGHEADHQGPFAELGRKLEPMLAAPRIASTSKTTVGATTHHG